MKKNLFLIAFMLFGIGIGMKAQSFETASTVVKKLMPGWNLGNSLDSHAEGVTGVEETETLRNQPVITKDVITMMKNAGFKAIRVPVTWYPHMDTEGNIDPAWLARVKKVVDMIVGQNMYCIINVHHDTGKKESANPQKGWMVASGNDFNLKKDKYVNLWTQIANYFKSYNQYLLFEGYNELLDNLGSWNYASYAANNHWNADLATSAYDGVNSYAKAFVEAVRATGGNNAQRNLIINTYAAAAGGSEDFGEHWKEPLTKLIKPEESWHIIAGVHVYPSLTTTDAAGKTTNRTIDDIKSRVDYIMTNLDNNLRRRGLPVLIGEWGSANVDKYPGDYIERQSLMCQFAEYFVQKAKELNIGNFYWNGLSDRGFRTIPFFNEAELAKAIVKGATGSTPSNLGKYKWEDLSYYGTVVDFTKMYGEVRIVKRDNPLYSEYDYLVLDIYDIPKDMQLALEQHYPNGKSYINNVTIEEPWANIKLDLSTINSDANKITLKLRGIVPGKVSLRNVYLVKRDGTKEYLNYFLSDTSDKTNVYPENTQVVLKSSIQDISPIDPSTIPDPDPDQYPSGTIIFK